MIKMEVKPIEIKIISCKGLQGHKSGSFVTSLKIEFGNIIVGESSKFEVDASTGVFSYNYSSYLELDLNDPLALDEIAKTPVVVTFLEILPKDKKGKEEKTNTLGRCCVDLLPLLRGETLLRLVDPIHLIAENSDNNNLPEAEIVVSSDGPLLTEDQLENCNLMTICVESAFSLPESWTQVGSQYSYAVCLSLAISGDKEAAIVIPNGLYRGVGEKELTEQRKWSYVPSASGSFLYIPNTEINRCPYGEEDGDLTGNEDVEFRKESEDSKPRVTWNAQRRCFLSSQSSESFQQKIAQYRKLPFEIVRTMQPGVVKGKTKDEDLNISYHGVAYVDLAPLLYPGVRKVRGAYLLKQFNQSDMSHSMTSNSTLTDEIIKSIIGINQSNSSLGKAGVKAKNETKIKQPSITNVKGDPNAEKDVSITQAVLDGEEYAVATSYIIIEIELEKPLVQKRQLSEVTARVGELITPRPPFPKKQGGGKKATQDYLNQIKKSANFLLDEFRKMFGSVKYDESFEETMKRTKEFHYHLNISGKYYAMKEQLRYFVTRVVREKFLHTTNFESQEELQEFTTTLYLFLLDHMKAGVDEFCSVEEKAEIPKATATSSHLKQFALEAEKMFRYDGASKYYKERIARDKNDPESHLDYGVFCLLLEDTAMAEESFKEVLAIQKDHLYGLMLYGSLCSQNEDFGKAEDLLVAATYISPEESLPWTLLGLLYCHLENDILAERSFKEAMKYIEDEKSTIFIEATQFLLSSHLLQLAERSLAQELVLSEGRHTLSYITLLAELRIQRKEYEEASQHLEQCLIMKHDNPRSWTLKGDIAFILKKFEDAKRCYERALAYRECKEMNTIHLRLGNIYLESEMYEDAKKCFLYLCRESPSCLSWFGVGIACYRMGNYKEAEFALNEANINDNYNADVWFYLTLVCLKTKRLSISEQCYKHGIQCGNAEKNLLEEVSQAIKESNVM